MNKRRISSKQSKRIKQRQTELCNLSTNSQMPSEPGLVISSYGKEVDIEDQNGNLIRCKIRQNLGSLIAGDQIIWQDLGNQQGVIIARTKRSSVLGRPNKAGIIKPIAANISQILITIAIKPEISLSLLDSYLVLANTLNIPATIILNKTDLLTPHKQQELQLIIKIYEQLKYLVIQTSAKNNQSLDELDKALQQQTSVFVGQSGVGKSSLISKFIPDQNIKIGQISDNSELGRHTTTNSTLYHLQNDGYIIDSPGIRQFGLWNMSFEQIAQGFIEFQNFLGKCKFSNCSHKKEPGCAITEALQNKLISQERYHSYQLLIERFKN